MASFLSRTCATLEVPHKHFYFTKSQTKTNRRTITQGIVSLYALRSFELTCIKCERLLWLYLVVVF